ncbi:AAA family ATPase [Candidatus Amarolinea dominans]|uniref:AAA family ATPase n=1 Tax=Candidatus Amarolinea dominans TaxID=3140696 RepID=UPI001DA8BA68|nr:ATP-dependent Clp protease ATP-binding subunit [Anaerolineae bacterium]
MPESGSGALPLAEGAQRLVEGALQQQTKNKHAQLGVNHWLLVLMERHGAMAEALAKGFIASALEKYLADQLRTGRTGEVLSQEMVVERAAQQAVARGKSRIAERDLAVTILAAADYMLVGDGALPVAPGPDTMSALPSIGSEGELSSPVPQFKYEPRLSQRTPLLEQFGRDVTRQAAEGRLSQIIGRETEVQLMTETLCRRTKRNPLLVGPAGVGKTAVVEGLAQRIVRGGVPDALLGARLIALQPSTLIVGGHMVGDLEKRMQALLHEASQDGVILFIDEVHTLIGAGGMPSLSDLASLLKPALARGEIACIAATTDDEYRRFIEPDAALERRFQPIRVQELTASQTLTVLASLRNELMQSHHVQVGDGVLPWLVDLPNTTCATATFLTRGIDLLEQTVAYSLTQGKQVVEVADARAVAERLIGMPPEASAGLNSLRQQLTARTRLDDQSVDRLVGRLEVTARGLDLRPTRPNAVVLLVDDAVQAAADMATVVAETLFGSAERVLPLDFSRFVHPADVTMLIGAPPGYVGYADSLLLDRLSQTPWCVVLCQHVHACHPTIRDVWTQALSDGFLTNSRGKRSYLSDTITILTVDVPLLTVQPLGFHASAQAPVAAELRNLESILGPELLAQVDVVITQLQQQPLTGRSWLRNNLLADITARFQAGP